jgi:hypothetical protein
MERKTDDDPLLNRWSKTGSGVKEIKSWQKQCPLISSYSPNLGVGILSNKILPCTEMIPDGSPG